jgi:hypothetical protein
MYNNYKQQFGCLSMAAFLSIEKKVTFSSFFQGCVRSAEESLPKSPPEKDQRMVISAARWYICIPKISIWG